MSWHEKCGDNEFFAGNSFVSRGIVEEYKRNGIKSARYGRIALDIEGKKIKEEDFKPIFIDRKEEKLLDQYLTSKFRKI